MLIEQIPCTQFCLNPVQLLWAKCKIQQLKNINKLASTKKFAKKKQCIWNLIIMLFNITKMPILHSILVDCFILKI